MIATPVKDKQAWTITTEPGARREVHSLATLTQLLLDLAGRVDSLLRRNFLTADSGNAQSGEPRKALGSEIVVIVADGQNTKVSGASVTFRVTGGGGTLGTAGAASAIVNTDASGKAAVSWTLGPDEGLNAVEASIVPTSEMVSAGPVTFVALGREPPPTPVPAPGAEPPKTPEPMPENPGPSPEQPAPSHQEPEPILGKPERPSAVPKPELAPEKSAPEPVGTEAPPPAGPALKACDPIGLIDWKHVNAWLDEPILSLTFDRPMNREDFTGWPEWLRWRECAGTFRSARAMMSRGPRRFRSRPRSFRRNRPRSRAADGPLDSVYNSLSSPTMTAPEGIGVFVVLIDPGRGGPWRRGKLSDARDPLFQRLAHRRRLRPPVGPQAAGRRLPLGER